MIASEDAALLKKQGYVLGAQLGEGSYAKVRGAYEQKAQKRVAVKIINKKKAPKDFREKFLPRELKIHLTLDHPNVIKLHNVYDVHNKVFMVMEYAGHGDLLEYIKLRGAIPEERARVMFKEIVDAIDYLHKQHVIHRDMKCENLLLDSANHIKVSDFGFCRSFEPGDFCKTFCGSAAYAAPEILQGIAYHGPMHDIWSMGVILFIMVLGSMPYDDSNIKKMVKEQTERILEFPRSKIISVEVKDLIHRILECNVKRRAVLSTIMAHPWLSPPKESSHMNLISKSKTDKESKMLEASDVLKAELTGSKVKKNSSGSDKEPSGSCFSKKKSSLCS